MRQRANDERGAVLIILSVGLVALLAVAGLVLDGGRAYGERRQMQNASDAAAMAATRELDRYLTGQIADASRVLSAARHTAEENGADPAQVTCTLVTFERDVIEACPTGSTMSQSTRDQAAGVTVGTKQTQGTLFMAVVGQDSFTATADATAQIGSPGGSFVTPFLVCATAPGNDPPLLVAAASKKTGFAVNRAAIGHEYFVWGNEIKEDGRDCGNPSSSFRGLVNIGSTYPMPGDWNTDTGNHNGPTVRLANSGNYCWGDFDSGSPGCVLVLPLCPRGNGQGGTGYRAYCVDLGLFEITSVDNANDGGIQAIFRGGATINRGGIAGPVDPDGSRIVALTE